MCPVTGYSIIDDIKAARAHQLCLLRLLQKCSDRYESDLQLLTMSALTGLATALTLRFARVLALVAARSKRSPLSDSLASMNCAAPLPLASGCWLRLVPLAPGSSMNLVRLRVCIRCACRWGLRWGRWERGQCDDGNGLQWIKDG